MLCSQGRFIRANSVCRTDKGVVQDQYKLRGREQTSVKWTGHAVKDEVGTGLVLGWMTGC